jgi:hypothetical protein
MDRKVCILLYSKYSNACRDLLKYIQSLPFDFPSITGLSMMSVDNKKAKDACNKNGIKGVPVLLIEYFFVENSDMSKKQMMEKEQIYQWIDEVVKTFLHNKNTVKSTDSSNIYNTDTFGANTTPLGVGAFGTKTSKNVTFLDSSNKSDVLPLLKIPTFDEAFAESGSLMIDGESEVESTIKTKSSSKRMSTAAIAAEMEQQRKNEDEKFTTSIKKNKFGD